MDGRSTISDVFSQYDRALDQTRGRIEESLGETTEALDEFYNGFLKNHVINYSERFKNEVFRRELHRSLQQRHKTSTLKFWAIDGACRKIETADLAIFYGGAYVVKGTLGLQENPPKLAYDESAPEDDSSIVAYLPLSSEDLTIIDPEDRFMVNDSQRFNLSGLDTSLMLLAEVFLLYRGSSGIDHPHMLIWDNSFSSVLANATPNVHDVHFAGIEIGGEKVWYPDLLVGYSKPWNEKLDVPSRKSHRLWERCIARIYSSPDHRVELKAFAMDAGLSEEVVSTQIRLLWATDKFGRKWKEGNPETALVKFDGTTMTLNKDYLHSPDKIRRLFEHFCNRLFRDKDPTILLYEHLDIDGNLRKRFFGNEEITFLMAIGLRMIFENCWRNNVMLIGVVKDSASTYFTRNYLGVLRKVNKLDFEPKKIPNTDRMTFERLPYIDEALRGPWSSTEFDGVFMTLRLVKDGTSNNSSIQGVRGDILVQPNILMRSLVQFHMERKGEMEPSMGHVIFVDRLVHPGSIPERVTVIHGDRDLGTVEPFWFSDATKRNKEQEQVLYLLSVLTRNVFPEVIGYPDPLHYADRGGKECFKNGGTDVNVFRTVESFKSPS